MTDDLFCSPVIGAFPPPRAFQVAAHDALRQGFKDGHRCQILVAATGSGKTYCALRLISESLKKFKRAWFVCDRITLVEQTSTVADSYGLCDHAIIQATHTRRDMSKPFQIASIQTLAKRGYWGKTDLIVVDECHTQHSAWVKHIQNTDAAVIGLTATPCSKGLGKLFTNMVNAATMHELTQQGVLVPMRVLTCVTPDMAGADTSNGEWTDKAAAERELTILGDVVSEWQNHAENRKTIAFGANVAYCKELVKRFDEAGVQAASFTYETSDLARKSLLREYRKSNSRLRVLVSVEALAKGFDVPDVECVIDARPLRKSLSTAIQMWGRGLRASPETAKADCLLLDHSGNFRRMYDDFCDIYFNGFQSLDAGEQVDRKIRKEELDFEPSGCPKCGFKPFRKRCMKCGYEKPVHAAVPEKSGVMKEIVIGKRKAADSRVHLWQQLACYATKHSKNPQKRAAGIYRDIIGSWPPRDWRVDTATHVEPTPATLGKIQSLNIAWARRRRAS